MRSPSPAFIVTSVVLALASTAASAVTTATTTTSMGTTSTPATAPRTATGGCTGTGGSSCSTASTATATSPGTSAGSTSSAPSETLPGQNVTAPAPAGTTASTSTSTGATGATNPTAGTATAIDTTRGATNNSTGPLVDIVQGSGATVGTASTGSTTDTASNNPNNPLNPAPGLANGFVVPGIVTDVGAVGDAGNGVNANGERVANAGGNAANNGAPPNSIVAGGNVFTLPLYDATTKAATAREIRRRERGQEPRVIGMAPRTDNDLTWQMPDDRIIRY